MNLTAQSLLAAVLMTTCLAAGALAGTIDYTADTTSLAVWDRPDGVGPTISTQGPVHYHAQSFVVNAAGDYDLVSTQAYNGYLHLYQVAFDAGAQLTNLIGANDDGSGGPMTSEILGQPLTTGTVYTLVTSGNIATDIGTFTNTISGPGTIAMAELPEILYFRFNEGSGGSCENEGGQGSPAPVWTPVDPLWVTPGQLGAAAVNNDASAFLNTGFNAQGLNTVSWTIEFWYRTFPGAVDANYLFGDGNGDFSCLSGGPFGNRIGLVGAGLTDMVSVSSINDGMWHHLAYVYDRGAQTLSMYLDGSLEGQNLAQVMTVAAPGNFVIGDSDMVVDMDTNHFDIDDFRVWSRVRLNPTLWTQAQTELGINTDPDIAVQRPLGTDIPTAGTDDLGAAIPISTPLSRTWSIVNEGFGDLTLTGSPFVEVVGTPTNCAATITTQPGNAAIAPAGVATFTVDYTVTAIGAFSFDIVIASDDPDEDPYTFTVTGAGVLAPEITVQRQGAASDVENGGVDDMGNLVIAQPVTVTIDILNIGVEDLNLNGSPTVSLVGTATNADVLFSALPGALILPGEGDTVVFTLTVPDVGPFSFNLMIPNDDPDENPFTFTLSGMGATDPEIEVQRPVGTVRANGGTDAQGSGIVVGVEYSLVYTVQNTGSWDLLLGGTPAVTISGAPVNCNAQISEQPALTTLQNGESTTFTVTYSANSLGGFQFTIGIVNNDLDEAPYSIVVTGEAVEAPEIDVEQPAGTSLTPGSTVDLGEVAAAVPTALDFVLSNLGVLDLQLTGTPLVSLSGVRENVTASVTAQPSVDVLTPLTSDAFQVTYTVSGNGSFAFTVMIQSNDLDEGTFLVTFTGTGLAAGDVALERVAGTPILAGETDDVGELSIRNPRTYTYTLRNEGTFPLQLTGSTYAVTLVDMVNCVAMIDVLPPSVLPAGESTTFAVTFTVGTNGDFSFTVRLPNNDPEDGEFAFVVAGIGVGAPEVIKDEDGCCGMQAGIPSRVAWLLWLVLCLPLLARRRSA